MVNLIATIIRAGADLLENRGSDDLTAIGPGGFKLHQKRDADDLPWVYFDDQSCFDRLVEGGLEHIVPTTKILLMRNVRDLQFCHVDAIPDNGSEYTDVVVLDLRSGNLVDTNNKQAYVDNSLLKYYCRGGADANYMIVWQFGKNAHQVRFASDLVDQNGG